MIGVKIIASSSISAMRKDVLAKCYGGDISRKKKLLKAQAKGKKRMKSVGSVDVPQAHFTSLSTPHFIALSTPHLTAHSTLILLHGQPISFHFQTHIFTTPHLTFQFPIFTFKHPI